VLDAVAADAEVDGFAPAIKFPPHIRAPAFPACVMESPMNSMSQLPGASLARCSTRDWRLVMLPVRGTGMMAVFW